MPSAHPVRDHRPTTAHAPSAIGWFVAGLFFTVLGVILVAGGDSLPGAMLSVAGIVVLAVVILHIWRQP